MAPRHAVAAAAAALWLSAAVAVASPTVLVTGATGRTGALLYGMLKEKGVNVRGLVRNVTKAKELLGCKLCDASEGIFVGDVKQIDTLAPAMAGITGLAIATSATPICNKAGDCSFPKDGMPVDVDFLGAKNQVQAFTSFGSKESGLGPVVLCSSMGTTEPDDSQDGMGSGHILFYKLNAEAFLMSSGLPFTIVKPCGLTNGPAGQAELVAGHDDSIINLKPPLVSRADVARVMAEALLKPSEAKGLRLDLCSRQGEPTTDLSKFFVTARYPWQHSAAEPGLVV